MYEPNKLYFTDDPALKVIGPYNTLANWRVQRRGPAFIKIGARVAYRGSDLNAWLDKRTVRPTAA